VCKFVSDRMSYIVLRGRWHDIVLKAHAPTDEKSDDSMDSFYKELEQVFDKYFLNTIVFDCSLTILVTI